LRLLVLFLLLQPRRQPLDRLFRKHTCACACRCLRLMVHLRVVFEAGEQACATNGPEATTVTLDHTNTSGCSASQQEEFCCAPRTRAHLSSAPPTPPRCSVCAAASAAASAACTDLVQSASVSGRDQSSSSPSISSSSGGSASLVLKWRNLPAQGTFGLAGPGGGLGCMRLLRTAQASG